MGNLRERMYKYMAKKKQLAFNERYRQYIIAKANIPYGLSPLEYEAAVKKLAKKYKI